MRPSYSRDDTDSRRDKRVRDWGLKYDGSPKSIPVERFLFRVESLQKKHGISCEELYANFHLLLEKQAQEWFWLYMEEHADDESSNFTDFRKAFLNQFRQGVCDEEIRMAINERIQGPGESFDDYYAAIRGMAFTMKTRLDETALVNIIKRNLRFKIRDLIFGCTINNLDQLRYECRRAEKHLSQFSNKGFNKRKVDELAWPAETPIDGEDAPNLEAFERKTKRDQDEIHKPVQSHHQQGYTREEKSSPCPCSSAFHKLTCFKCDQPNLKCFICDKCEAGNRKADDQSGKSRQVSQIQEKTPQ
ncbi:hypothetical protein CVS40_11756 [Lucilia cuprina]|nr:hypothetical protein CVS40_11756 [Lucilia cuprina]